MEALNEIQSNHIITTVIVAWIAAQGLKMPIEYFRFGKIDMTRFFFGAGGMPSSHSALVTSACVAVYKMCGGASAQFGIMLVLALIVMYDASGVRRAAGEQAKVLNKILEDWSNPALFETKLKELLGHTPLEVFAGAVVGLIIGILW
jgi:acid phosphatase family membrane protein YuiD